VTVRFSVEVSVRAGIAEPEAVVALAEALEAAGIDMLGYTDHPAPSRKWLAGGGQEAFDPFAALRCASWPR
jgi:hypothetical protein